jgi:hypothetical protein
VNQPSADEARFWALAEPLLGMDELITTGRAQPFAPSGRPFREWAAIQADRSNLWPSLLDEALASVADRSS